MVTSLQPDQDFARFVQLVKTKSGIDLALYKEPQMKRRLSSLRERRGYDSFVDFYNAFSAQPALYGEFLDQMTINVSEFFRNPQRWDVLRGKVLPELLKRSPRLKCWSAACSTGEEPYSITMLLSEFMNLKEIQLLATDLDQNAIGRAKIGNYQAAAVKDVPKAHLNHFFRKYDERYLISDEVKRCVQFKQHNLLADRYETGFDLIVCRNVLIYFTDEAKESIFAKFSQALKPGGYLFIGGTEQIFQPHLYGLEATETFFYRKQ
ncbi:chemotaxis protein methyltransferase CheR [Fontibacillus phaseoli]|uniref:protein-glutamate O-methyltransferase n=1 Tax=Fontibacillus phaseoli TaxID=1416533 RepID=A0A369AZ46_9BACL|nr:protein-glutamate O-methyltransferase CheR [Fontibacillus phaseoli]RCX14433.1 chemotaxis protein methyltransferase CheR [Fontibacillus phaseoli]